MDIGVLSGKIVLDASPVKQGTNAAINSVNSMSGKIKSTITSLSNSIKTSLQNSFKIDMSSMSSQLTSFYSSAQALSGIKNVISGSISEYSKAQSAMMGLASASAYAGINFETVRQKAVEFASDGSMSLGQVSQAMRNLFMRGYSLEETIQIMMRLKDAAAFNRQASLGWGEAIVAATEGLKNENSILVDNAGVTKNVAKMWEDYAKQLGISTNQMTLSQKRQAEFNGIMQETQGMVGNTKIAMQGMQGAVAKLSNSWTQFKMVLGQNLAPAFTFVVNIINGFLEGVKKFLGGIQMAFVDILGIGEKIGIFIKTLWQAFTNPKSITNFTETLKTAFADVNKRVKEQQIDIAKSWITPQIAVPDLSNRPAGKKEDNKPSQLPKPLKDVSNVIEDLRRKIDESTSAIENFGNKGGIELGKITAEYNQLIDKYKGNGKIIDLVNQWYNLEKQRIELQETDDYVQKIVEQQVAYEQTNKELERSIKLQQLNIADTTGFSAQIQQIIDKYDDLKEKNKDLADSFEELKQKEIEAITTLNRQKLETDLFDKYNSYLGDLEQAQMQYFALISPNAELQSRVLDAHFRYQQRIQEAYSVYANNPKLIEQATSFYTQLRDAEIQFAQDTTLTDTMQTKLAQVQGVFNAFHDVFDEIGNQLGTSLAQAFEEGFNFREFMANLGQTLRFMAIQKTVALLFEAAYQQIMASIYRTLAVSQAIANPALAAAYTQAALGAQVAATGALAGAAVMGTLATGLIAGMAHDGISYIPDDGTWLLQKGERVVDSNTNKDLKTFLNTKSNTPNINMTVNINGGDEQSVLKALPKLKETILNIVNNDIASGGRTKQVIRTYAGV